MKPRLLKTIASSLIVCVIGFTVFAFIKRREPVLLQLFADRCSACGDFHEEMSGWIVLNPFRERSPERSAKKFLAELRNNSCSADAALCRYSLDGHRSVEWRLANRQNADDRVLLYYRFTKFGEINPQYHLSGEGLITVTRIQDSWVVTGYSSYF